MQIFLNEVPQKLKSGTRLYSLRDRTNSDADILIVNGHPAGSDLELHEGDHIVMITRGKQPSAAEFESLMMARQSNLHFNCSRNVLKNTRLTGLKVLRVSPPKQSGVLLMKWA